MKKKKWTVDQEKKIGSVVEFIKKYLRLEPSENLVSAFIKKIDYYFNSNLLTKILLKLAYKRRTFKQWILLKKYMLDKTLIFQ